MTSLLNLMMAKQVAALFENDLVRSEMPDEERMMSREEAEAVIHAAIWAYSCDRTSTAGAMAKFSLFDALRLESWKFKPRVPDQTTASLGEGK